MPLKKEDFTDEQWAEIVADLDRARTDASKTARKNAEKEAETEMTVKIAEAVEKERAKLEADEQGKLEIQRKEIETAQTALVKERKSLAATKKLVSAGFGDEDVEALLPIFVGVDDKTFDATIESFIKVNQATVKSQVDAVKQELLNNATPPASPSGAPVDAETAARAASKAGNDAQAFDILLGATPQQ
jgi:hypothetical protein